MLYKKIVKESLGLRTVHSVRKKKYTSPLKIMDITIKSVTIALQGKKNRGPIIRNVIY